MVERSATKPQQPWAEVVAIGTGCVVTLVGIYSGVPPEIILLRAVVSALAVGIFVVVADSIVSLFLHS
jgi:ABC-type multidrug transport system permease subunit